jgi:phosphopantothenate-cysteine ligase
MSSSSQKPTAPFSTEAYFQTQHPPAGLDEKTALMREFVDRWRKVEGKRVVLVTVGRNT